MKRLLVEGGRGESHSLWAWRTSKLLNDIVAVLLCSPVQLVGKSEAKHTIMFKQPGLLFRNC